MRIWELIVLLTLAPQKVMPLAAPAKEPRAEYPVRVRLDVSKGGEKNGGWQGYGRGTLLPAADGAHPREFNYTYTCPAKLESNAGADEFYQGKWTKQDLKLDVLTARRGLTRVEHCELAVMLNRAG